VEPAFLDVEAAWQPLAPAARTVWGAAGASVAALAGLAPAVVAVANDAPALAVVFVVASGLLGAWWWWLVGRRWRAWGYAERDADLLLRRGVLVRRLTVVPYGRMQFVDVRQGPLARTLGLATVKLHTAAAATDAEIPLVGDGEARRLRDRLTTLGEAHAAGL